jgi:hypothetical protein
MADVILKTMFWVVGMAAIVAKRPVPMAANINVRYRLLLILIALLHLCLVRSFKMKNEKM